MPCNAVGTVRATLATPQSLDEAIKALSLDQAKIALKALAADLLQTEPIIAEAAGLIQIRAGKIWIILKHDGKRITTAQVAADPNNPWTPISQDDLKALTSKINDSLIAVAKALTIQAAINKIKAAVTVTGEMQAPNGSRVINIEL